MKKKFLFLVCAFLAICISGTLLYAQVPADEDCADVTSKVVNPEFDSDAANTGSSSFVPKGWTKTFSPATSKMSVAAKGDGVVIVEGQNHWQIWNGSAVAGKVSQTISNLPNGQYTVRAGLFASFGGTVTLYANEGKTNVVNNASAYYEATGTVHNGMLEIGLDIATTGQTTLEFDHITLQYCGSDLEGYNQLLAEKLAAAVADTLAADRPGYCALPQLRAAIARGKAVEQTDAALIAAIAALDAAIAEYESILAAYQPLKEAIAAFKKQLAASAYPDKNDMEAALATAQTVYDNPKDQRSSLASTINVLSVKVAELTTYDVLGRNLTDAKTLYNKSDYPGKTTFQSAIAVAQAVYDAPSGKNLNDALVALESAQKVYLQGRPSEFVTIRNGALWKIPSGASVQAHGAGFVQVGDTWYMIGEDRNNTWNPDVNMYSTKDFVNWKFERKIIQNGVTHSSLGSSRFIERPKLMYCEKTGKFVVWCHWEQGNYGASEAAVFYCDSVNGPYKFHWAGRPLDVKSRDCNVFVDNDGTAYFISTTNENRDLGLFRLSDDYLSVVSHTVLFAGQGREAPAIVRVGDTYFMISSACTGWDPNQAKLSYSSSLTSGWSGLSNIGNGISYDTQAASILTVQGSKGTTYLYVGDRWQDPGLAESKTIIFPIQFSGKSCTFAYRQQFDVNFATGEWRETETTANRVPKTGWKIRAFSSQETSGESGAAANAIDGNVNTKWHTRYSGTAAAAPHSIEVDMGATHEVSGFLCTPRMDNSTNGLIRQYLFEVSVDGTDWKTVSGGSWMPYGAEVYFTPVSARYFRLTALAGTYASIAELDMLKNTTAYTAQNILPYYKIGSGSWQQATTISNLNPGVAFAFGPNYSATGTWAFSGPNGHQSATREYNISSITPEDAGVYTSVFLNAYNQSSRKEYTLSVKNPSSLEGVSADDKEVSRKYYNLQGLEVSGPLGNGVHVIEKTYESGAVATEKTILSAE